MAALSHILVGTLGLTELTIVIIIGILILAIPALIVIAYWANTRRAAQGPVNAPAEAEESLLRSE
jgi:FtsZ-interacting cell division protein ZipA